MSYLETKDIITERKGNKLWVIGITVDIDQEKEDKVRVWRALL